MKTGLLIISLIVLAASLMPLALSLRLGGMPAIAQGFGLTTRVSVASDGTEGNGESGDPAISGDGRYVAFDSEASNLVLGDTNDVWDIFVHDRQTGQTSRASVASGGTQGNNISGWGGTAISGDGRYVAFDSEASNLVLGDTNGNRDVFVHDRQTGQTTRVGAEGNGDAGFPAISGDGRYVAFESYADNLVLEDTNGTWDVFVHDRQIDLTTRISVASDGTQGNNASGRGKLAISGDGRYVAFTSWASNLVYGDTNGFIWDVFVHDRQTSQTTCVSVASDGTQGNIASAAPAISDDGRYVAFVSWASNLVDGDTNGEPDVFVHDRQTGQTTRVSVPSDGTQGNGNSGAPAISSDGRYVAFNSAASNLVGGDTNGNRDIFVHDRQTSQTTRASVASDDTQGNSNSGWGWLAISDDGRYVAFNSEASNLVDEDTNGKPDVFVHDRGSTSKPAAVYLPIILKENVP